MYFINHALLYLLNSFLPWGGRIHPDSGLVLLLYFGLFVLFSFCFPLFPCKKFFLIEN